MRHTLRNTFAEICIRIIFRDICIDVRIDYYRAMVTLVAIILVYTLRGKFHDFTWLHFTNDPFYEWRHGEFDRISSVHGDTNFVSSYHPRRHHQARRDRYFRLRLQRCVRRN